MPADPNGNIYWNGCYHLGYIYHPDDLPGEHAVTDKIERQHPFEHN